jgi:hypothetical protein
MTVYLPRLFDLYLLVLDRTGVGARLSALPLFPPAMPVPDRAAWAAVAGASAVLLLWAALASGPDTGVKTFRAAALLLAATLPLAAARVIPGPNVSAFAGGALAAVFVAGLLHRSLARRRRAGAAARLIERARWAMEAIGLVLFAIAALRFLAGRAVPLPLVFWAFFLLRLSIADLLDPSRLARETGLTKSAAKDLKAAGRAKGPAVRRGRRALTGFLKILLVVLWLALPILAALARGEVERGEWPPRMLLLTLYPAAALALTALLLLVEAARDLVRSPLTATRGALVGLATALWLVFAFGDPAFAVYRHALPGLYLFETAFGFLLGAASRGR